MQNGNRQVTVFYVCALSLWLRVPHKLMRALSNPLAPPGRGLG
ncbi:Uncharacterised protein [Enterobacter hormaechei]|nr:Uncharacterised protein [Enterobacter hormaechei]SAE91460.1 Uncharacterised protein [Enterobacter hormaechei]SAG04832.1 Uncharacterised protein [Enterobacter hormaechei]VAF23210.1 Uncharacterised protein [Enterobacter hormaechei]VAG22458.1 Uncharacterised protein [Enterobacter hormaechei]